MASASMTRSLPRWATRQLLLAIVVVVAAMVGLALLAEAMSGGGGTVYLAQIEPGGASSSVPSLVAVGYGQAAVPPDRVELQMLFTDFDAFYGNGPGLAPTPEATPGTAQQAAAEPIVAAIQAAGVPADRVRVVVSPTFLLDFYGPSGVLTFRLDVTLDQPDLALVTTVIDAAAQAGLEHGLRAIQVGAAYLVADCGPLRDLAWQAALADARRRVDAQAAQLGVTAGQVLISQEEPTAVQGGTIARSQVVACGVDTALEVDANGASQLSVPPFEPAAPLEVVAAVRLNLAVEIVDED